MNNCVLLDKAGNVLGLLADFSVMVIPEDVLSGGDLSVDGYAEGRDDFYPLVAVDDALEACQPGQVFVGRQEAETLY